MTSVLVLMRRKVTLMFVAGTLCWFYYLFRPACVGSDDSALSCTDREDCIHNIARLRSRLDNMDQNAPVIHRMGRLAKSAGAMTPNQTSDQKDSVPKMEGVLKPFLPALSSEEKKIVLDVFETLINLCDALNVTYFMYGGTLLGSYRHHDVIPWDDDVDIIVPNAVRPYLFSRLKDLRPNYGVSFAGPRLKFFSMTSPRSINRNYPWRFPYVDISFYDENKTHLWDSDPDFDQLTFEKDKIFPLHKRPLANLWANAPYNSYYYLNTTYPNKNCQTYHYSHKREATKPRVWIKCERLNNHYGFVHRVKHADGVLETLKVGDVMKHAYVIEEPTYVIPSNPYSLDDR